MPVNEWLDDEESPENSDNSNSVSLLETPEPAAVKESEIFGALNHIGDVTDAVVGRLPRMSDDEVLMTRDYAREVGKAAWRIECACDAEILNRTQARRGRGNVDADGTGVMATVAKVAAEVGVTPGTIFRNAQIHNTFFADDENTLRAQSILEEKRFYEEALRSGKPHEAIELMAAKKAENPFYTTRDAQRDVEALKVGRKAEPIPLPADQYSLLLADPPWQYDFSLSDSRAIENQYPTMTVEEICCLPVGDMATDDSVLFLWATSPKLPESIAVLNAWGFTYKTCMVWVKDKIGMGYYARQQHELLLIATKGNPSVPEPSNRPPSVITADRTRHSAKPEVFRETIERMYPDAKKVELFCRSPRDGWDAWGNEV